MTKKIKCYDGWQQAVVAKQAGDCQSSASYLNVCRQLLWSQQSAHDKQSRRCFLSLRQHSNFTLNFAAIIQTQKYASVVQKKLKSSAISCAVHICVLSLSGQAKLVWACDDMVAYFSSGRFQLTAWQTVNTLFFIWVQKVTILWLVNK